MGDVDEKEKNQFESSVKIPKLITNMNSERM